MFVVNEESDITASDPDDYPCLDDIVLDRTVLRVVKQYATEGDEKGFATQYGDFAKAFFSGDNYPAEANEFGF